MKDGPHFCVLFRISELYKSRKGFLNDAHLLKAILSIVTNWVSSPCQLLSVAIGRMNFLLAPPFLPYTISRECPRSTGLSKLFAVFKLGKRYLNTYMAKWTNVKILETWNWNSSFKYFGVVRIEKQIRLFVFWKKLRLNNFVPRLPPRSTGL